MPDPATRKEPIRVYADTSVYGGTHDDEFASASTVFFEQVRSERFRLVVSAVVAEEIANAPDSIRALFDELLPLATVVEITTEALSLIARCKLIVSWNFRHIVHFQKIPLYNAVNILQGYDSIAIHSPLEVIANGNEDV